MTQPTSDFALLNMVRTGLLVCKADVYILFAKSDEAAARLDALINNGYVFSRDGCYSLSTSGLRRMNNVINGEA